MRRSAIGAIIMFTATACGQLGVEQEVTPSIESISVAALPATFAEGDTATLAIAVVANSAATIDSIRATSSNLAVASVKSDVVSRTLVVAGLSTGVVNISVTAYASGKSLKTDFRQTSITASVAIIPNACTAAQLQLPRATLWVGESAQLTSTLQRVNQSVTVSVETFASQNPSVVSVTAAGTLQARGRGNSEITYSATCAGTRLRTHRIDGKLTVTVTNEDIALSSARDSVKVGRSSRVTAIVSNLRPNGSPTVTWTSRNAGIAVVGADGTWRGVALGSTWLDARLNGIATPLDSVAIRVADGCQWLRPIALGQTITGELSDLGQCSNFEEIELRLPTTTLFIWELSAGSGGGVNAAITPGFNGGWPTIANPNQSVIDSYILTAGTYRIRLASDQGGNKSYIFSLLPSTTVRCEAKAIRGVTFTALLDASCPYIKTYFVDDTPGGRRTIVRVMSNDFAPQVELNAWNPFLAVVASANGSVGAPAVINFVPTVSTPLHFEARSRSSQLGSATITIDPP